MSNKLDKLRLELRDAMGQAKIANVRVDVAMRNLALELTTIRIGDHVRKQYYPDAPTYVVTKLYLDDEGDVIFDCARLLKNGKEAGSHRAFYLEYFEKEKT